VSVLVCGGKLTYPIKVSTDSLGVQGVNYVERLTDYLEYNAQVEKILFIETVDNRFNPDDFKGFQGEVTVFTKEADKFKANLEERAQLDELEEHAELDEPEELEEHELDEPEELEEHELEEAYQVYQNIVEVIELEGLRLRDIQYHIMKS